MSSTQPTSLTDRAVLSVVISARDEATTIADAVRAAARHADEVIVMDGHSRDRTAEIARAAGARVHLDSGAGKGAAVREGLRRARGEIVVLMDADGSHDGTEIPRLVEPIRTGAADLVVGSRFAGGSEELSATVPQLIRLVGNVTMNIVINARFGVQLTDTLNGFRALRGDLAASLELRESRHTIEQEMVIQALRRGYRVINVPSHERARVQGTSHINIWREWPRFVWCLARNVAQPRVDRKAGSAAAGGSPVDAAEQKRES